MNKPRFSLPLLLTIVVPIFSGIMMLGLVLIAFEAARSVAVAEYEQHTQELVELMANSIERFWIAPRNDTTLALSSSKPLHRQLSGEASKAGTMSTDITFYRLSEVLDKLQLSHGGSAYLVDESGTPFLGTNQEYIDRGELPHDNGKFFVESSAPMSNGWRVSIIVPRQTLAESFSQLRRPILIASATILLTGSILLSLLVWRTASRAYRLAEYFRETSEEPIQLRQLFKTYDEFSFLNDRFNKVINDSRKAQEERLSRERTFRFLIEQSPIGFFRTKPDGSLLYLNPHCAATLGYTREEALEKISSVVQLYYDKQDRELFLSELTKHGEVRNMKIRFWKKSGEVIWISMTARIDPREADSGQSGQFDIEGFILDITRDMEERQWLMDMAQLDPLTGAANRRAFDEAAHAIVERTQTNAQTVALILFDIDQFKPINDTYGHDVGDLLLQQVVNTGQEQIRDTDIFARFGGDEFAILLPGADKKAALRLAKRLKKAIKDLPSLPQPLSVPPTLSIGVGVLVEPGGEVTDLIKAADNAMYDAKRAGRNRIACHTL